MTHDILHETADEIMPALKRILVPTDFSPPSQRALIHALRLGREAGAEIYVLHVAEDLHTPRGCSAHEYLEMRDHSRRRVKDEMTEFLKALPGGDLGATLHLIAVEGVPSSEIVREAVEHNVDLIVISTHGHTGFQRFLLGSTADKVVRLAPCPVLVIRKKHTVSVSSTGEPGALTAGMDEPRQ